MIKDSSFHLSLEMGNVTFPVCVFVVSSSQLELVLFDLLDLPGMYLFWMLTTPHTGLNSGNCLLEDNIDF